MPIKDTVVVDPRAFSAAVTWAAKWIDGRPSAPIYSCLLLEVTSAGLVISSHSEHTTARAVAPWRSIAVGDTEAQRAVVSGKLLAALAATFGGKDAVEISGGDDGHVHLKVGRWTGSLPTMPEKDFPALPGKLPSLGTVSGDAFAQAVALVGVAGGKDPILGPFGYGIHLTTREKTLRIMATDKYRAACIEVPWSPGCEGAVGMIAVPAAPVITEAAASFAGPDDVTIGYAKGQLSLTSPTRSVTMSLLDATKYTDAALVKIFTSPMGNEATFAVADTIEPLKRAMLMRDKEGPVRLAFTPGLLTIGGKGSETDRSGEAEVDAEYTGEGEQFGFNPRYLGAALSSAPGDRVTLRWKTNYQACVLTTEGHPTWVHTVQPLRLDMLPS